MTDEQIKKLAQSCAEACLERYASVQDSEMAEAYSDVMETAIRTILETHCIVEKKELQEALNELKEDAFSVCEFEDKLIEFYEVEDTFHCLSGKDTFNGKDDDAVDI